MDYKQFKTKSCVSGRNKDSWTLNELKEICRQLKLKVSGNKENLCQRIEDFFSISSSKSFNNHIYDITSEISKLDINKESNNKSKIPNDILILYKKFKTKSCLSGNDIWTSKELKEMCKKLGLEVRGNKIELCQKLEDFFNNFYIEDVILPDDILFYLLNFITDIKTLLSYCKTNKFLFHACNNNKKFKDILLKIMHKHKFFNNDNQTLLFSELFLEGYKTWNYDEELLFKFLYDRGNMKITLSSINKKFKINKIKIVLSDICYVIIYNIKINEKIDSDILNEFAKTQIKFTNKLYYFESIYKNDINSKFNYLDSRSDIYKLKEKLVDEILIVNYPKEINKERISEVINSFFDNMYILL